MMPMTTKVLGTSLIALFCGSLLLTVAARAAAQVAPAPSTPAAPAATSPGAGPVIVVETVKGTSSSRPIPTRRRRRSLASSSW